MLDVKSGSLMLPDRNDLSLRYKQTQSNHRRIFNWEPEIKDGCDNLRSITYGLDHVVL
jgi:hypothetical protein